MPDQNTAADANQVSGYAQLGSLLPAAPAANDEWRKEVAANLRRQVRQMSIEIALRAHPTATTDKLVDAAKVFEKYLKG